jgi:cysteine desulfurase/selenocysteine lyase
MDAVLAAAEQFGPFDGRAWFNTAHQGPMPRPALEAARHAAGLKAAPHRIRDDDFSEVPERLRGLLARLVGGDAEQVVLGNSTSYGLHLVANGLSLGGGDDVLVVEGDYPATVLPWRRLAGAGVRVRVVRPRHRRLSADDVAGAIEVLLVVNASQALGARPLDVTTTPVDAVVACGYKWLCGPYGTGFAWLHPELLARLQPQQAYWLAMQAGRGLEDMRDTTLRDDLGARAHDVFCPAAFATTLPWIASLELFLGAGVEAIERHDQRLVDLIVDGLRRDQYDLVSPANGPGRSTLVVLSRRDGSNQDRYRRLTAAGVDAAYREGNIRLSVHLFNDHDQIDRALQTLHAR